jgi:hypothetical protein
MDGTYSLTKVGDWAGIAILGTAYNNLTLALNGPPAAGKLAIADGIGYIEGFSSANALNHFGAGPSDATFPAFDDNDNSGILRYVSIRHTGAIIATANELNALSLGSVGRGTTIEHVEIVATADDDVECFGGTVNLKWISTAFGDDDKLDWDLGYQGKVQFFFAVATDSLNTGGLNTTDNGFEMDADDNGAAVASANHSSCVVYNATVIGNGHYNPKADNSGPAALQAKELTAGEVYNSVFVNFRSGLHMATSRSNSAKKGDAYDQWTNDAGNPYLTTAGGNAQPQALKVKNNTFVNCGQENAFGSVAKYPITKGSMTTTTGTPAVRIPRAFTAPLAADTVQFKVTDGNVAIADLAGIFPVVNGAGKQIVFNGSNSVMTTPFKAIPTVNLTTSMAPPVDGFFSPANYRGAFDANDNTPWLSEWCQNAVVSVLENNPTDIDGNGITNIDDFLIFAGRFGYSNR